MSEHLLQVSFDTLLKCDISISLIQGGYHQAQDYQRGAQHILGGSQWRSIVKAAS